MATPLPFPGLSALLGAYGKVFGSVEPYPPLPADPPTMTAVIPALNEASTIPYALTSLAAQTVPPETVIVVDDGSDDGTARVVERLAEELDVDVELRRHDEPQGKTVGVKEVARSSDADTLFVLDADTYLESEDYLETVLAPHTTSGVASSFGMAYPTDAAAKRAFYDGSAARALPAESDVRSGMRSALDAEARRSGPVQYVRSQRPVVQFRYVSYHVEQRFFGDGFMRLFDSTLFPVGCGVLYDREKLVSVFDDYEASLGDDLTNSEDIFVGFAFCDRGWSNVRIDDAYMRSAIPGLRGTFKQIYRWGSGFLQSAYYFGGLTRRYRRTPVATDGGTESVGHAAARNEPARGRPPLGRGITARIIDGLYPTTVLVAVGLAIAGILAPEIVGFLLLWEFTLYTLLAVATRTEKLSFARNYVPFLLVRFLVMPVLTYTYLRVGWDIVSGDRNWRK